jgi:molecular chaperone HscB
MNYFELFGLPTQFELDGSLLSSQFRELQKQYHPDNFAAQSDQAKLIAVQKAAEINDAYRVLKSPAARAEYLLQLQGIDLQGETQTMQDMDFLMQQMELRETLEALERRGSDAQDELMAFDDRVSRMHRELLASVAQQLEKEAYSDCAVSVRKLKFIAKLKEEIARVEDKFFDM